MKTAPLSIHGETHFTESYDIHKRDPHDQFMIGLRDAEPESSQ